MKRYIKIVAIRNLLFGALFLIASTVSAIAAPPGGFTELNVEDTPWSLVYLGSDYDAQAGTTTFNYTLTVDGPPALSHMVFEIPVCSVFVSASPNDALELMINPDPTTGIPGLKFDGGQPEGTTWNYSVTLAGAYAVGEMTYSVKGATKYAISTITGPVDCGEVVDPNTYSISGTIFVDGDKDGFFDAGEPIVPLVTVGLYDVDGNQLATVITDENGEYLFEGLTNGDYVVKVLTVTNNPDDVNETLDAYFDPTTATEFAVTIDEADEFDVDAGYTPNIGDIQDDLNPDDPDGDGVFLNGNGLTIGYWKHQLKVAISGKGKAQVNATILAGYVDAIEALYIEDPFQFADSNEFADAFNVLSATGSDGVLLLKKQLLGTEFNEVSGLGLANASLQDILIAWGEYLVFNAYTVDRADLIAAKDIFDMINNTGHW